MRKYLIIIALSLLFLPSVWPFFQKGFFWTQDIIYLTRINAAANALVQGQFPMRWVSDLRYGEPLFNYYAPLPYYIGAVIHFSGFDFIQTAKIIFVFITILSGIFMYFLAREFWGFWGGVASAFLYVYAPYRAVDLYLRGTLSELFASTFFPLIFFSFLRFSKTGKGKYFILAVLSTAALFLTHNIMTLIFSPFLLAFLLFLAYREKKNSLAGGFFLSLILSLGISAFFWLPAYWEKDFVQTDKMVLPLDYFVNNFVKWEQFIKPLWDGSFVSHELGIVHILFLALSLMTFLIFLKKRTSLFYLIPVLFSLFLFSLFMQNLASLNLWLFITPLSFVQFPWRFAGITMFFQALLGGAIFILLEKRRIVSAGLFLIAVLMVFILQKNYFWPNNFHPEATDKSFIIFQEDYLPKDYLPTGVKNGPPFELLKPVRAGDYSNIGIEKILKLSDSYSFNLDLQKPEQIVVPVYYFQGWKAFENEKEIILKKQPKTGLILLSLSEGRHNIFLKFTDTPIRTAANFISAGSLIVLMFLGIRKKSYFPS